MRRKKSELSEENLMHESIINNDTSEGRSNKKRKRKRGTIFGFGDIFEIIFEIIIEIIVEVVT